MEAAAAVELRDLRIKWAKRKATLVDATVQRLYAGLQRDDLVNPNTYFEALSPEVNVRAEELNTFHYMGRAVTGEVIDFILRRSSPGCKRLVNNAAHKIRFITGTPGAGKSVSFAVAAAYLHLEFRRDTADMRRIAFFNVQNFIDNPGYVLWSALTLAFKNDVEFLNSLESMGSWDVNLIILLLKNAGRAKNLYLLFDDGNKLDQSDDYTDAARRFINALAVSCVVIMCSSIRSKFRKSLLKDTQPEHLLICGGYNKEELQAYIQHSKMLSRDQSYRTPPYPEAQNEPEPEEEEPENEPEPEKEPNVDVANCIAVTGMVPRLVFQFVFELQDELQSAIDWYKNEIRNYMSTVPLLPGSEFLRAVRGEPVSRITEAMDSLAFYCGPDGRGKCLTEELHCFTLALISKKIKRESNAYAKESKKIKCESDAYAKEIVESKEIGQPSLDMT